MAGFIRRFSSYPGNEVITQIEGVNIIDLPPPASIQGLSTGVVGMAGEFVNCTAAVDFDPTTGDFVGNPHLVEIFSSKDMLDKLGGFDATLGDFGNAEGNGFVALRNKKFSRLFVSPVNIASTKGVRVWRELPTNETSGGVVLTNVPITAATVSAGYEFKDSSNNRIRLAGNAVFTGLPSYTSGSDGTVTNGAPAATNNFNSATANFLTSNVKVGDALVMGTVGASGAQGANAGTYRVFSVTDAHNMLVEKLDGSNFTFTASSAMLFQVYPASNISSAGNYHSGQAGAYNIPVRPLDAQPAGVLFNPTVAPPTQTEFAWNPLSGLKAQQQTAAGITYTANVQGVNPVNNSDMSNAYIPALFPFTIPNNSGVNMNIIYAARHSGVINSQIKTNVENTSMVLTGQMGVIAPELQTGPQSGVSSNSYPGVGANRSERVVYTYPCVTTFIPEAVGSTIKLVTSLTTTDGIINVGMDGYVASLMSNLAPELNIGQIAAPVPTLLGTILSVQDNLGLSMNNYIAFKALGVAAVRSQSPYGPFIQSAITSSLVPGQTAINRRRMADFIEDSIASALLPFDKLPLTNALMDSAAGEVTAFLDGLLSPNNPAAQRIADYKVDDKSGNTPDLLAQGIFVINVSVRTLATADFIVLQFNIGPGVEINNS